MKKRFLSLLLTVSMVASCVMTTGADTTTNTVDLTDGLVAEYLFDGDFADEHDSSKVATAIGENSTLIYEDASRGNVVSLAGGVVTITPTTDANGTWQVKTSPSGLMMPSSIIADNDYSEGFTISFWVKSNGANGFSGLMDISDKNGIVSWGHTVLAACPQLRYNGWGLSGVAGDDYFETGLWPADSNEWLGDTGWELCTITVSSSKTVLYVNGTANTTDTDVTHCARLLGFLNGVGESGRTEFKLGTFHTPGDWTWNWDAYKGYMDDVRVWNRALTAEEVTALTTYEADTSVVPLIETIGAQANLDDATQLGFVTLISKAQFDATKNNIKEMGIVVKNSANATNLDLTVENATADGAIRKIVTNYVTDVTTLDSTKSDDLTYAFRSVIKGISDSSKTYTAVPYITYKDGTTVYGAEVTRSLAGL